MPLPRERQECHADALIKEFLQQCPGPHGRCAVSSHTPPSFVLNYMSQLREEHDPENGSSANGAGGDQESRWKKA